jgi:putative oxidoreductase
LGTRLAAFIASGEMAVAYWWMHAGGSGKIFWWENRGELVMLFCFIWLVYACWGAGPLSVDRWLESRRAPPEPDRAGRFVARVAGAVNLSGKAT